MGMRYEDFAADVAPWASFSFDDAEEHDEELGGFGIDQETRQTGAGQFRFDMAASEAGGAKVWSSRYRLGTSIVGAFPRDMAAIMLVRTANDRVITNGQNVARRRVIVCMDGQVADITSPDLCGAECFAMPRARFHEIRQALCPASPDLEGVTIVEGDPGELEVLRNGLYRLATRPDADPDVIGATIAWTCSDGIEVLANGSKQRVAKQARSYIHEHYASRIRIEDLCRATGVGVRTLQRCFSDYFDLTIRDYIKTVRLDGARRELRAARPIETTVAAIASLSHLGRFSVEFRKRFGELPSDVLARPIN
jgi:AraC family ethanolamine operon transcriptional activator